MIVMQLYRRQRKKDIYFKYSSLELTSCVLRFPNSSLIKFVVQFSTEPRHPGIRSSNSERYVVLKQVWLNHIPSSSSHGPASAFE